MIFKNVTENEMYQALELINKKYDNNILFKSGPARKSKNQITATLTVNSTKDGALGYRRGHTGRKIAAACWHVHGDFFDTLIDINPDAVIVTGLKGKKIINKDGGNWQDANIGSQVNPMYYSEACDCNGGWE